MCVIGDMLRAVAVVALAPGAVAEFQIRIRHIRAAADSAAVGVGCLGTGGFCFVGAGLGEGDHFRPILAGGGLCLFAQSAGVDPPGGGNQIQNILATTLRSWQDRI